MLVLCKFDKNCFSQTVGTLFELVPRLDKSMSLVLVDALLTYKLATVAAVALILRAAATILVVLKINPSSVRTLGNLIHLYSVYLHEMYAIKVELQVRKSCQTKQILAHPQCYLAGQVILSSASHFCLLFLTFQPKQV